MKASVKPNGQTKVIAGKTANGYDMSIEVPTTLGGRERHEDDGDAERSGLDREGRARHRRSTPASTRPRVDKGWIFSDPRGAKGNPGQAKAMAEMYKQFAAIGGIPYETEMNMKMGGDGPMAGMMAKMGSMSAISTVESVETGALAADLFAPPAGYKIKEQK